MPNNVNSHIKPLIGNDNALSIEELKQLLVENKVTREELETVLTDDLLTCVDQYMNNELSQAIICSGDDTLHDDKERTHVFFWGLKGSGKTTVIGTLLATQPESCGNLNTEAASERCKSLCYAFSETGCNTLLPVEGEDGDGLGRLDGLEETRDWKRGKSYIINTDIKDQKGKVHPLALIEMESMSVNRKILQDTTHDKIHILCYDCTRADTVQDNAFINLLNELKRANVLKHSVGVYLLVTKTDCFAYEQKEYREELAQSLITGEHNYLWTTVKNVCSEMQISDATPIPYYIGDVKLQQAIKIDLSYARQLIEKPLALKSNPYRSFVGKALMFGSWQVTMILLAAACIAITYCIYRVIPGISNMPTDEMTEFDYISYFTAQEEERVKGKTCTQCDKAFNEIEQDLQTESSIILDNDRMLMKRREYRSLASQLYDDYEEAVIGGLKYEINGNWHEPTMKALRESAKKLIAKPELSESKRTALNEVTSVVDDYFEAKKIIDMSNKCKSEEDVDIIKKNVEQFIDGPLATCTSLVEKLNQAIKDAENSYEKYKEEQEGFHFSDIFNW